MWDLVPKSFQIQPNSQYHCGNHATLIKMKTAARIMRGRIKIFQLINAVKAIIRNLAVIHLLLMREMEWWNEKHDVYDAKDVRINVTFYSMAVIFPSFEILHIFVFRPIYHGSLWRGFFMTTKNNHKVLSVRNNKTMSSISSTAFPKFLQYDFLKSHESATLVI